MSKFQTDLNQEHILSDYLDGIYKFKNLYFERIHDLNMQHRGVDVIFNIHSKEYLIDEKAQLHYLNQDLPTFTFELSYLNKESNINQGWLLDEQKLTQYYFLITGIFLVDNNDLITDSKNISALKITSVNRAKLIAHLDSIGLSKSKLIAYDIDLRTNKTYGKNPISEFKNQNNVCLYFTQHLSEQPINLQLRLNYLIENRIAKKFYWK